MKIISCDIYSLNEWEDFVTTKPEANFLSSWYWGQFHQSLKKKVFYRGYKIQDKLVGISLLVLEKAKRGNYLTCAGGPLLDWGNSQLIDAWKEDVYKLATIEKVNFVRVRPQILATEANFLLFKDLGFREAPMHLTADLTLQLDLGLDTDTLLSQMRKSTRYEIKAATKKNITTSVSTNLADIRPFYESQLELARKHNFVPFSYDFLYQQFKVFSSIQKAILVHSFLDQTLLATAFIIMYGNEAVYHYGVSTLANQKLPGAYAAQWRAINEAKKRGIKRYNFWGIAPHDQPHHRFSGVSLFKRGFGGQEVSYLPAHDLPINANYALIYAFEKIRAKTRNL